MVEVGLVVVVEFEVDLVVVGFAEVVVGLFDFVIIIVVVDFVVIVVVQGFVEGDVVVNLFVVVVVAFVVVFAAVIVVVAFVVVFVALIVVVAFVAVFVVVVALVDFDVVDNLGLGIVWIVAVLTVVDMIAGLVVTPTDIFSNVDVLRIVVVVLVVMNSFVVVDVLWQYKYWIIKYIVAIFIIRNVFVIVHYSLIFYLRIINKCEV